jgi:hypothetical protein
MSADRLSLDPDAQLGAAIRDEFEWGRSFLQKEGSPGAELTVTDPDRLGARIFELGGRFDAAASYVASCDIARR